MNPESQVSETAFPIGLVLVPAFVGALVWISILVSRFAAH